MPATRPAHIEGIREPEGHQGDTAQVTPAERRALFTRASKLLGDDAGIENDPYGLPSNQGEQPPEDRTDYLDWATDVRRWYRFRPFTQDATIWRLHAQGLSVRDIETMVILSWSRVAARIRLLLGEIKAAEKRRSARGRSVDWMVAASDPLFLVEMLRRMHG